MLIEEERKKNKEGRKESWLSRAGRMVSNPILPPPIYIQTHAHPSEYMHTHPKHPSTPLHPHIHPSVQNPKSNNKTKTKMDVRTQIMTQDGEMDIPIHGNDQHHHALVLATSSMVRVNKKHHP